MHLVLPGHGTHAHLHETQQRTILWQACCFVFSKSCGNVFRTSSQAARECADVEQRSIDTLAQICNESKFMGSHMIAFAVPSHAYVESTNPRRSSVDTKVANK
jgi:hypothetical protein